MNGPDVFNPPALPLDQALLDPLVWARFSDGYACGYSHGHAAGRLAGLAEALRVDRDLEWLPAHDQLQQRRRQYRGIDGQPARAQTPRQIRARAEYSWRLVEREIADQERGRLAG